MTDNSKKVADTHKADVHKEPSGKSRWRHLLWQHYTASLPVVFAQFKRGAIYFSVGLMTVLMANVYLQPSLTQELVVLAGLVLGGIGFVIAMAAQLRMIIGRILHFLYEDKD